MYGMFNERKLKYQTPRIIIVEDERIIALDIQNSLVRAGYQAPAIYSSGEAAITAAEEVKPDIILMDIRLKGSLNGFETAERIRGHYNIPVIFLSAFTGEKFRTKAETISPYGIVGKPVNVEKLLEAVEKALNSHFS